MLEMYNDADDLMHLVEAPDFEGNDIFWYLDEYSLFDILDSRIMDKVIQKKWIGWFIVALNLELKNQYIFQLLTFFWTQGLLGLQY